MDIKQAIQQVNFSKEKWLKNATNGERNLLEGCSKIMERNEERE